MFRVCLGCFCSVVGGVVQMTLCSMRVMRRGFVIAALVVPSGFTMVPRRMFVMFRCFVVMVCRLPGHGVPPAIRF